MRHSFQWSANSSLLTFIVVTIFDFLYITCNSSLVQILHMFCTFIGPYFVLSISCSHVLNEYFIFSLFAHISQPYSNICLITVVYIFSFVCFDMSQFQNFLRSIHCCYSCSDIFSTVIVINNPLSPSI